MKKDRKIMIFSLALSIITINWYLLELSSGYDDFFQCFQMGKQYIILNVLTIGIFGGVIFIFTNKLWLSSLVLSSLCLVIGIVNHYTILLHGMPFSVMDIKNVGTALNVIYAYKIEIDVWVLCILGMYAICVVLSLIIKKLEKNCHSDKKNVLL